MSNSDTENPTSTTTAKELVDQTTPRAKQVDEEQDAADASAGAETKVPSPAKDEDEKCLAAATTTGISLTKEEFATTTTANSRKTSLNHNNNNNHKKEQKQNKQQKQEGSNRETVGKAVQSTGGDMSRFTVLGGAGIGEPRTQPMSKEELFSVLTTRIRLLLSRQNISNDPSIALFMSNSSFYPPPASIPGTETPSTATDGAPSTANATGGDSTVCTTTSEEVTGASYSPQDEASSSAGASLANYSYSTTSNIVSIPSFHMDRPDHVSIEVDSLLRHPSLSMLGEGVTAEMVLDAADAVGPQLIRVDRERRSLHPVMRLQRCTLILRELDISEEELRELLLKNPELEKRGEQSLREVRAEVVAGKTHWFVTLEHEAQATEVALWLRSQKHKDMMIRVAVKSESEFQSFTSRPQPNFSAVGAFVPAMMPPMMMPSPVGGFLSGPFNRGSRGRRFRPFNTTRPAWQNNDSNNMNRKDDGRQQPRVSVEGKNTTQEARQGSTGVAQTNNRRGGRQQNGNGRGGSQQNNRRGAGAQKGNRRNEWNNQNNKTAPNAMPQPDPIDFPPLITAAKISSADFGYHRTFRQYSPEVMKQIQANLLRQQGVTRE